MMIDDVLATKIQVPDLRHNLIARPHLTQRLGREQRRLILISAPAGYGKTTLAAEWSHQERGSIAWLSLDASDNDPQRWMSHLEAALGALSPVFTVREIAWQADDLDGRLSRLMNMAAGLGRKIHLVLDDYQFIDSAAIQSHMAYLIDHLPVNLQVVILTRTHPAGLPLARLRARNQMMELRSADLRFRLGESASFLTYCLELRLDESDIAIIDTQVQGWAAGLQLVGPLLDRPVTLDQLQGLSSSEGPVGEYFLQEVLALQPEKTRRHLLHTAAVDWINGELAEALTGEVGGGLILHRMERANLFLAPVEGNRGSYRYHPMFLHLLQDQLRLWMSAEKLLQLRERANQVHARLRSPEKIRTETVGWMHPQDELTEREGEVLALIATGLSNDEIARQLVVTVNTVRTHIKSINRKFGVRSRTQAVYQAQQLGLLSMR